MKKVAEYNGMQVFVKTEKNNSAYTFGIRFSAKARRNYKSTDELDLNCPDNIVIKQIVDYYQRYY